MTPSAPVSHANLLIRGGYVLTMAADGDLPAGDVHIRDGVIQAVGQHVDAPGAAREPALCGGALAPTASLHAVRWRQRVR